MESRSTAFSSGEGRFACPNGGGVSSFLNFGLAAPSRSRSAAKGAVRVSLVVLAGAEAGGGGVESRSMAFSSEEGRFARPNGVGVSPFLESGLVEPSRLRSVSRGVLRATSVGFAGAEACTLPNFAKVSRKSSANWAAWLTVNY